MKMQTKKALVLAGSRGIGKAIANSLRNLPLLDVDALSSKDLDSSDLKKCIEICDYYDGVDVLVLNTGGPPAKPFSEITIEDWNQYHNQLFLGFALISCASFNKLSAPCWSNSKPVKKFSNIINLWCNFSSDMLALQQSC